MPSPTPRTPPPSPKPTDTPTPGPDIGDGNWCYTKRSACPDKQNNKPYCLEKAKNQCNKLGNSDFNADDKDCYDFFDSNTKMRCEGDKPACKSMNKEEHYNDICIKMFKDESSCQDALEKYDSPCPPPVGPGPGPGPNPTPEPTGPKPGPGPKPKPTPEPTGPKPGPGPGPRPKPTPEPTDPPTPNPTDPPTPNPTDPPTPNPTDPPTPNPTDPPTPNPSPGPKPNPSGKFDPNNPQKDDTTEDSFTYEPELANEDGLGPSWRKVRNRVFWVNDGTWSPEPADDFDFDDCLGKDCQRVIDFTKPDFQNNVINKGAHAFSYATTDMGSVRTAVFGNNEDGFNVSLKNGDTQLTYMNLNPGQDNGTATGPEFCQPYCTKKCCPSHGEYDDPFSQQQLGNASCFTPIGGDAQNDASKNDPPEDGGQDPYPNLHPCIDNRYPECDKEMNNYNCFWPKTGQFFYYDSSKLTKEDLTKRGFKFGK